MNLKRDEIKISLAKRAFYRYDLLDPDDVVSQERDGSN